MTQLRTLNGVPLSSLCFGTMQFGGTADADMSLAMYDACWSSNPIPSSYEIKLIPGAVRRMRTSLCKDNEAARYATPS